MRTIARIALAVLAAVGALTASPASADTMPYDLHDPGLYIVPAVSPDGDTVVQVNAGPGTWQIKRAARAMAAQVDGLSVRTSGDCATADVCLTVVVDWYVEAEMLALTDGEHNVWGGLTTYPDGATAPTRTVYLNLNGQSGPGFSRHRARVAAHEMGHVFGLAHHDQPGLMGKWGDSTESVLSPAEVAVLNAYYAPTGAL